MRRIGFSTGAIARSDFRRALEILRYEKVPVVELSALRLEELAPLTRAIPSLDLRPFSFVSIHAPSRFPGVEEAFVVDLLRPLADLGYPVVLHPDAISDPRLWRLLGDRLLIENMDKRKPIGRTAADLARFFAILPEARFCFDIGHARQVDPSMTEAALLLNAFGERLVEVHMSEVNTASRHDPLSANAVQAFRRVAGYIPEDVPIILEPLIDAGQSDVVAEMERAGAVFDPAMALVAG